MSSDAPMTFMEHLLELRRRVTRAAVYILVMSLVTWEWRQPIFEFLSSPIREGLAEYGIYTFRAIEIGETLFVYIKATLVAAIVLTIPLVLYELWAFVAPGLYEKEKQAIAPIIFFSSLFFLLGVYFAYEVVIPFMARYLAEVTTEAPDIAMDVTVRSAFDFALIFLLGFGVSFELPMIMFFLSTLGLVKARTYVKVFRYFVVISFIVAGILTPPDPVSQTLLALPLNLLYWVGVLGAWVVERRGDKGVFTFRARVWGILGLSLVGLGAALFGATTWFGRSTSALRFVPTHANWVLSVRLASVADDGSTVRAEFVKRLGITDAPTVDHVVQFEIPQGVVTVVARGCETSTPETGTCDAGDWLTGPEEAVNAALDADESLEKSLAVIMLNQSAPAFLWHSSPGKTWTTWLPGEVDTDITPTTLTAAIDLRGKSPWIEVGFTPTEAARLASLENRADIWRRERERDVSARSIEAKENRSVIALLDVVESLTALSDERFRLLTTAAVDPRKLATIATEEKRLRAELVSQRKALGGADPIAPAAPGDSLVERLGAGGLTRWKTTIRNSELVLRLELTPSEGLARFVQLLPTSTALVVP